ncbi:MAG: hypothetical protein NUV77_08640 [Thermoguttaceae bacterium]|jgi:hypothetical protein|nr:hypothetical protein [Thermoguttaceae bacterium]
MLIPQFTIRWLLGVTAVSAVVFTIVGLAVRGSAWAQGVSAAFVALALAMLVYALLFGVVWLLAEAKAKLGKGEPGGSPFGADPVVPNPPTDDGRPQDPPVVCE